jgi:hypothetical protein
VGYDVKRRPGGWVLDQASFRERRIVTGIGLYFASATVGLLLVFVNRPLGIVVLLAMLVFVALFGRDAELYLDEHARWRGGGRAEEAVGLTLAELRAELWYALHDIEQEFEGNIDHLVSGPGGVFMIETKEKRYLDEHLVKAKRQAAKLHDRLGVWVTPVICLHRRGGGVFKHKGVWIVPRAELVGWLREQHNATLSFEALARFADSL